MTNIGPIKKRYTARYHILDLNSAQTVKNLVFNFAMVLKKSNRSKYF